MLAFIDCRQPKREPGPPCTRSCTTYAQIGVFHLDLCAQCELHTEWEGVRVVENSSLCTLRKCRVQVETDGSLLLSVSPLLHRIVVDRIRVRVDTDCTLHE